MHPQIFIYSIQPPIIGAAWDHFHMYIGHEFSQVRAITAIMTASFLPNLTVTQVVPNAATEVLWYDTNHRLLQKQKEENTGTELQYA